MTFHNGDLGQRPEPSSLPHAQLVDMHDTHGCGHSKIELNLTRPPASGNSAPGSATFVATSNKKGNEDGGGAEATTPTTAMSNMNTLAAITGQVQGNCKIMNGAAKSRESWNVMVKVGTSDQASRLTACMRPASHTYTLACGQVRSACTSRAIVSRQNDAFACVGSVADLGGSACDSNTRRHQPRMR
jgi:hypothetical protein